MFPNRVFVTAKEVKPILDKFRLFDVRYSLENADHGKNAFKTLRVLGADFADLDGELCRWYNTTTTARHPLPTATDFIDYCKRRGIGSAPVLCYDDQSGGMGACRMWWMLDSLGVEAYVLNGGFQAAVDEGLATASGEATNTAEPLKDWSYRTEYEKLLCESEIPLQAKYVDARFAIRFNSTVRPYGLDTIAGHVPGSINHPWNANIAETAPGKPALLPEEDLKAKMTKTLGGTDATNFVFSCASGVTACMNIALAKHLGFGKPFLYCGAWSEYAGLHTYPLRRAIIETHGFCFVMKSKNLATNPKYTPETAVLVVDGSEVSAPDAEVAAAAVHMHIGESATVTFRSGRQAQLETRAR